jgi:hypothetical protein
MIGFSRSRTRINNSRFTSTPVKSQHAGKKKRANCPDIAAPWHQAKLSINLYVLIVDSLLDMSQVGSAATLPLGTDHGQIGS